MSYSHYILKIDSRDTTFKGTTNPIQISLNNSSSSQIERIIVKNMSIPHVFYNVNDTNNILTISKLSNMYIITWPIGQYTITTYTSYFNNSLQAIAAGVIMTFDSLVNKIKFTSTSDVILLYNASSAFPVIGLDKTIDFNILNGIPIYASFMCDLSGLRNLYVETSFSQMHTLNSKNEYKSYIANIPLIVPFGSIIHYINQEQELDQVTRSKMYSQNLNNIIVTLKDALGNILNLQNMHWEINFKISTSNNNDLFE